MAPAEVALVMLGAMPVVAKAVQGEVAQKVTFGVTVTVLTVGVGGLLIVTVTVDAFDAVPFGPFAV
jgi:hypothetical protein